MSTARDPRDSPAGLADPDTRRRSGAVTPQGEGGWEVRFTWGHAVTVTHPRFTYEPAPTESLAIDLATRQLDRMSSGKVLWLVEAHRRRSGGPDWIRVEWTAAA